MYQYVSHVTKVFHLITTKAKITEAEACTVTSASGTDIGPIGQCYLTFRLGINISLTSS